MKKSRILLIVISVAVVLACCACFGYASIYQQDVAEKSNVILVLPEMAAETHAITPGSDRSLTVKAENQGYDAVTVRQSIILSVYTKNGQPIPINGRSDTLSDLELYLSGSSEPCRPKLLQSHRAVYLNGEETRLDGAPKKYWSPFEPNADESESTTHHMEYVIRLDADALAQFHDCVIKVDLITESKLDGSDTWIQTLPCSITIGGTLPAEILNEKITLPDRLYSTTGFQWTLESGFACLTGLGSIIDTHIEIPAQVSLSVGTDGIYYEDPINGQQYPVIVASEAFIDCDTLQSVTFLEGVQIQNNKMNGYHGGMFEKCDNLQAVYGIPDSVTDMCYAFVDCVSLVTLDRFPAAVTNLKYCFQGCSALATVPEFPEGIANLDFTFRDCVSLVAAPTLPEGITQLPGTFYGCTGLKSVAALPGTLTTMASTFRDCTALEEAPVIPNSVTEMVSTFAGCTSLRTAPIIPDSAELLTDCFRGCTSLTGYVSIPFIEFFIGEFNPYCMNGILDGCPNASGIQVRVCNGVHDPQTISTEYPVIFLNAHQTGMVCPDCHMANLTTEIYGVEIIFENCHEYDYNNYITFLESRVPEWLTAYCPQIVFTDRIKLYYQGNVDEIDGFANHPSGFVYVANGANESTIIHELGHTFDYMYSSRTHYSSTAQWRYLHDLEGGTAASIWYNIDVYHTFSESSKRCETFAMAIEAYFCMPDALKQYCPGMYEYMDDLVNRNQ